MVYLKVQLNVLQDKVANERECVWKDNQSFNVFIKLKDRAFATQGIKWISLRLLPVKGSFFFLVGKV